MKGLLLAGAIDSRKQEGRYAQKGSVSCASFFLPTPSIMAIGRPEPVTLIPPFATPCVLVSNVLNEVIKGMHNCDVKPVLLPEEYRLFKTNIEFDMRSIH
jgi:hypothetical protein